MATLHPALLSIQPTSLGGYRERDVLAMLEQGLPDGFDVFHSVDWSAMHLGKQSFGEVDVVVMGPGGHVTLLEVKAGAVDVSDTGLTKSYGSLKGRHDKDVGHQARRQHSGLMSRLEEAGLNAVRVAHFLVLPDQKVGQGTVAYPRERIIDATQMDGLSAAVRASFPFSNLPVETRALVHDFLMNRFNLQPDPSTLIGQVQRASLALGEGLATWEGCRPTLIIMDDALVHSDPQRLEQMQRVVFDASQRHQILVITCHPANWKGVGASPVSILQ